MSDPTYTTKIYEKQGGDELVVASGGQITVESGGAIVVDGVTVDSSTLALNGLTATATELNQFALPFDIADGSADANYYLPMPYAGDIVKIATAIDGVVSTADITVTASIAGTPVTNGVVTIATAASAAGDYDEANPTAANAVTAGSVLKLAVAGGGSGGSPRIHGFVIIER